MLYSHIMKREREVLGKGFEHTVVAVRNNSNIVLKYPHWWKSLDVLVSGGHERLQMQYEQLQEKVADTPDIRIPKTRFFKMNNWGGYVIAQERITPDANQQETATILQKNKSFAIGFDSNHRNYIQRSGIVYPVDTTRMADNKFINSISILSEGNYKRLKIKVRETTRKVVEFIKKST